MFCEFLHTGIMTVVHFCMQVIFSECKILNFHSLHLDSINMTFPFLLAESAVVKHFIGNLIFCFGDSLDFLIQHRGFSQAECISLLSILYCAEVPEVLFQCEVFFYWDVFDIRNGNISHKEFVLPHGIFYCFPHFPSLTSTTFSPHLQNLCLQCFFPFLVPPLSCFHFL